MRNEWSVDPIELEERAAVTPGRRDETVAEAVDHLPKHLREVINCVFWERLSHPEAIQALGLNRRTYYRYLRQAKERLATSLQR